jgi:hypothetical protein
MKKPEAKSLVTLSLYRQFFLYALPRLRTGHACSVSVKAKQREEVCVRKLLIINHEANEDDFFITSYLQIEDGYIHAVSNS